MKNWFDIIPPHEDIRKGQFDEAQPHKQRLREAGTGILVVSVEVMCSA